MTDRYRKRCGIAWTSLERRQSGFWFMSCEHLSNHSLIADDKIIKNLVRSPWNTILFIFPVWWAEATLGFGDEQPRSKHWLGGPSSDLEAWFQVMILDRWMQVLMIQQNSLNSKGGKREKISKASEFAVLHILACNSDLLKRTFWSKKIVHFGSPPRSGIYSKVFWRTKRTIEPQTQVMQRFKATSNLSPHEPAGFFDSVRSGTGQLSTWRVQWFVIVLIYLPCVHHGSSLCVRVILGTHPAKGLPKGQAQRKQGHAAVSGPVDSMHFLNAFSSFCEPLQYFVGFLFFGTCQNPVYFPILWLDFVKLSSVLSASWFSSRSGRQFFLGRFFSDVVSIGEKTRRTKEESRENRKTLSINTNIPHPTRNLA